MAFEFPNYRPRPSAKWEEIRYRKLDFTHDAVAKYCAALRSIFVNGSAHYAVFEATNRDDFLSAYQYDHRGISTIPCDTFMGTEIVRTEFSGNLPFDGRPESVEFFHQGGCQFEGLLADVLLGGGAYEPWKGTVDEAKALGSACLVGMRSVAPGQPWSPKYLCGAWCSYFHDVAWDHTFLIQFPYDARWLILCATDTD